MNSCIILIRRGLVPSLSCSRGNQILGKRTLGTFVVDYVLHFRALPDRISVTLLLRVMLTVLWRCLAVMYSPSFGWFSSIWTLLSIGENSQSGRERETFMKENVRFLAVDILRGILLLSRIIQDRLGWNTSGDLLDVRLEFWKRSCHFWNWYVSNDVQMPNEKTENDRVCLC